MGIPAIAELHFDNSDESGRITGLAVMVMPRGAPNRPWTSVIGHASLHQGEDAVGHAHRNWPAVLVAPRATHRDPGSLAPPPRTTGVNFIVLRRPLEFSQRQINALSAVSCDNARSPRAIG